MYNQLYFIQKMIKEKSFYLSHLHKPFFYQYKRYYIIKNHNRTYIINILIIL